MWKPPGKFFIAFSKYSFGNPACEVLTKPLNRQPTLDWMSLRVGTKANQESP